MAQTKTYCDSCLDAAYDEGVSDEVEVELYLSELGADIADHLCDNIEVEAGICDCPCKKGIATYGT